MLLLMSCVCEGCPARTVWKALLSHTLATAGFELRPGAPQPQLTVPLMSSGLKLCLKASTMHDSSAYDHSPISGMNRSGAFTSTDGGR